MASCFSCSYMLRDAVHHCHWLQSLQMPSTNPYSQAVCKSSEAFLTNCAAKWWSKLRHQNVLRNDLIFEMTFSKWLLCLQTLLWDSSTRTSSPRLKPVCRGAANNSSSSSSCGGSGIWVSGWWSILYESTQTGKRESDDIKIRKKDPKKKLVCALERGAWKDSHRSA